MGSMKATADGAQPLRIRIPQPKVCGNAHAVRAMGRARPRARGLSRGIDGWRETASPKRDDRAGGQAGQARGVIQLEGALGPRRVRSQETMVSCCNDEEVLVANPERSRGGAEGRSVPSITREGRSRGGRCPL